MLFKGRNIPIPLESHFLFIYAPLEANNVLNISFVAFLKKEECNFNTCSKELKLLFTVFNMQQFISN